MRGDVNEDTDYGRVEVRAGEKYVLKALCQTLPYDAEGRVLPRLVLFGTRPALGRRKHRVHPGYCKPHSNGPPGNWSV